MIKAKKIIIEIEEKKLYPDIKTYLDKNLCIKGNELLYLFKPEYIKEAKLSQYLFKSNIYYCCKNVDDEIIVFEGIIED